MKELIKLSENEYKKMIRNQKLFEIGYFIDQKGIYNYILKGRTKTKDNMTLNGLAKIVSNLSTTVSDLSTTLSDLSTTVNGLSTTVNNLLIIVKEGFEKVNTRLDNVENDIKIFKKDINTRLDGIVKVNNLKDPSKKF